MAGMSFRRWQDVAFLLGPRAELTLVDQYTDSPVDSGHLLKAADPDRVWEVCDEGKVPV